MKSELMIRLKIEIIIVQTTSKYEGNEEVDVQVLVYFQINRRSSIRHVTKEVGINPHKVHFIFKKNVKCIHINQI